LDRYDRYGAYRSTMGYMAHRIWTNCCGIVQKKED
jgi:hypothetical protein